MELLGRDAHLAPQAKLSSVGEAGGHVPVHRSTVHQGNEPLRRLPAGGDDAVAVAGGVGGNVGSGNIKN